MFCFQNDYSLVWVVAVVVGILVSLLLLLVLNQNSLIYQPDTPPGARLYVAMTPSDAKFGLQYEDVHFEAPVSREGSKRLRLNGWLVRCPGGSISESAPTMLYFHGNAGNISFRVENAVEFAKRTPCNVFLVAYRGYFNSEGSPDEVGMQLDAEAALQYLHSRKDINRDRIFAFGRSIGGAVCYHLAHVAASDLSCIIVENTFTSIVGMVGILFHLPTWVEAFLWNKWDNLTKTPSLKTPVLFVSGRKDELVPCWMMDALYESCPASKEMFRVPLGSHNDTYLKGGEDYYKAVATFINAHCKGDKKD